MGKVIAFTLALALTGCDLDTSQAPAAFTFDGHTVRCRWNRYNCGYYLSHCDDGKAYECVGNVQVSSQEGDK